MINPVWNWGIKNNAAIDFIAFIRPYETLRTFVQNYPLIQNGQQETGSGTYQDTNLANAIPITVTGTFVRPTLSLMFDGIIFEGVSVSGLFEERYASVGGMIAPLILIGEGISEEIDILLVEDD